MSDIDINKLRRLDGGLLLVFRELLRTHKASRVAERLGLSQPAVSHALGRLRDLFDDPLFVRRPHGFEPTQRAIDLGPQIEALIGLADRALTPERSFDPASSTRTFNFGAPEFITALIGGELVRAIAALAPQIRFVVSHTDEREAFEALRLGELDFAIGRFGAARAGYVVEPLYEDAHAVVVRKGHPRIRAPLDWETWRTAGHVFASNQSETADDRSDVERFNVASYAVVPHWLTALMMVATTDAIATCPRRLASRYAQTLGLEVLDPPFEPKPMLIKVLRRAGAGDPGTDWLLAQVRAAIAAP